MASELQLNEFKPKKGVKYKMIQITDIAFHTNQMTPTPSLGKKIRKSFEKNAPDRAYNKITEHALLDQKGFIIEYFKNDPEFQQYVREEEAKGYKVVMAFPKEGVPQALGKDTIDFMNSVRGKRVLRRLYKNTKQE